MSHGISIMLCILIDVVAEVDDKVEVLLGEVLQSCEISILIILARSERKPDTVGGVFGSRYCLGTSYRADFTADDHSVEILMPRIQSTNFSAD
jgi:hypothetical protein